MFRPAGVVATVGLVGAGVVLGIPAAFIAGAGAVGFVTSALLHLRDPKLAAKMVAPEFDRDLSVTRSRTSQDHGDRSRSERPAGAGHGELARR